MKITSAEQRIYSASITAPDFGASLTWVLDGWDVWIDGLEGDGWTVVSERHFPWPHHFDQATRDKAATWLVNEIERLFPGCLASLE